MTKQINQLNPKQPMPKTTVLKWATIGLGIAILALWISWFVCDCIFVNDGIWIDDVELTAVEWHWNSNLYRIQELQAIVLLSILGCFIALLMANMVISGLYMRNNIKRNLYHLLTISAAFIAVTICVIKAAEMMINKKYIIDIVIVPAEIKAEFSVYHLDFLKWMSIPPGAVIFASAILWQSLKKFSNETLIKDCNILIIAYSILVVGLFVPFVIKFGFNDKALPYLEYEELKDLIESRVTWGHITAQCITSPMGVFAGMLMVLLVVRTICVIFTYNNRWIEKKTHLIIFTIISFLVIAAFIASHVNQLDFVKLLFDYDSMKVGGLLVVLAEAVTCLAAGVYCSISQVNYLKRA